MRSISRTDPAANPATSITALFPRIPPSATAVPVFTVAFADESKPVITSFDAKSIAENKNLSSSLWPFGSVNFTATFSSYTIVPVAGVVGDPDTVKVKVSSLVTEIVFSPL